MKKFFIRVVTLALAAFLYSLAFPSFISDTGWGWIAFFAWIPVFICIDRSSLKTVWLEGAVWGFLFYLCYNYWLKTFHPLAILIAPVGEAIQFALLFVVLKLAMRAGGKRRYLLVSLLFCAQQYLTQKGFLAYPYGNLASTAWRYPVLMQSASFAGIWLLGFAMITPQAFVALKGYKKDIPYLVGLWVFLLVFGILAVVRYDSAPAERELKVACVQHSADSWKGGYDTYRNNYETLRDLTVESLESDPDLVVWSETAFVPSVAWHTAHPTSWRTGRLVKEFVSFGSSLPVPLVTGNPEGLVKDKSMPAVLSDGSWNWKTYNTVILFNQGKIFDTYRKQHLVPFTEHFPYGKTFPRFYQLLKDNDYKWWESGDESVVFTLGDLKFSTPICFEDIFGDLNARFVRNGADLLINLSNDSWSGSVAAEMQHLQLAVFRAVENRRPLICSTNSGITALVDITGRVIEPMEPFVKAWHSYRVPLGQCKGLSLYTRFPDLFAVVLTGWAVFWFVIALFKWICEGIRIRKIEQETAHLFDSIDPWW